MTVSDEQSEESNRPSTAYSWQAITEILFDLTISFVTPQILQPFIKLRNPVWIGFLALP